MHHANQDLERCTDLCQECHEVCLQMVNHCLQKGGRHGEAGHIRLLLDCAEICETSANFLIRGSDLHMETCRACAQVCERCSESCERLGDDERMLFCAEVCRRCAASCNEMAGAMAAR